MYWLSWLSCAEQPIAADGVTADGVAIDSAVDAPACNGALGTRVGECAPDFVLPTADGEPFILAEHLGQIMVVHVASTGETLDRDASQLITEILSQRSDVIAVDVLSSDPLTPPLEASDAIDWQSTLGLTYPTAYDTSERFGLDWLDTSLTPSILVLDVTGEVLARIHEQYEQQLPNALATVAAPP